MIRRLLSAILRRDTRHSKFPDLYVACSAPAANGRDGFDALIWEPATNLDNAPPITPARAALREQIRDAEERCQCQRVGELRGRMRNTLHEELAAFKHRGGK